MAGLSLGAAAERARPLFPRALERNLETYWEYWLLGAVVVLQLWINWHFARQSGYQTDDIVLFEEAAGHGLSVGFLTTPAVGQFSPGGRLVTFLIQHYAPLNWSVGLGLLLALHSASVVLLHRIIRLFAGPAWWTFPLVFAYGVSLIFLP